MEWLINKTYFLGRTTKDVELKTTASGTAIGKFSIAVDSGYGENKKTNFFNLTAWGKTAETISKFAPKGTKLLLECQAVQNTYQDKNGNNVNTVDFTVLNFEFAESKGAHLQNAAPTQNYPDNGPSFNPGGFMNIPDGTMDELPFS